MDNAHTPGGNTTTAGAVEQLAMARRIYAQFIIDNAPGVGPDYVPKFDDNAHGVKIALAAIIETQRRDAALAEGYFVQDAFRFELGTKIAAAIRSGQQFRKDV